KALRTAAADSTVGDQLVRDRIAEGRVTLPPGRAPQGADQPMHLVRARCRRPVDRAGLEVVEAADPVRCARLVSGRVTENRRLGSEGQVASADRAVHLEDGLSAGQV